MSDIKEKSQDIVHVLKEDDLQEETDFVESTKEQGVLETDRTLLKQGLHQRHIQMLTLVCVFGTGIFLSSGGTLKKTGPVGMLLGYIIVGAVVGCNMIAIAEVSAFMPATGATIRHAEQFIDEAAGFTFGWISTYASFMPGELAATAVIMKYWTDLNSAVFITIFGILFLATNLYSVRFYGEVEYMFGWLKVGLLIILIITSLVIVCGGGPNHDAIGFRYWKHPGPFAEYLLEGGPGRMCGFWSAISSIVYAYSGIQNVAILAGETKNSRHAIFYGAKNVFTRVLILYLVVVFFLTMVVPSNDPKIASDTGTAESSPFVIAMKNAQITGLPHVINAIVLTSAWSSGNTSIIEGSRNLFALATKRQAPQIFLKTSKRGIPYVGIAFMGLFMPLAYMSVSESSSRVFSWFQELLSSNTLIRWILTAANHIYMHRALKAQGYSRADLPYTTRFGPFAAWFSFIMSILFLFTGGFTNFITGKFELESFFTRYFVIPLSLTLFTFWKLFKGTKYLKPEEVDLASLFRDIEENPEIIPPKEPFSWRTVWRAIR